MSKKINWMIVLVIGMMGVVGCQTTAPLGGKYESAATYPKVTLSDKKISNQLRFGDPITWRNGVGLMKMTQPVREAKGQSVSIQYRIIWLDETRQPIAPAMNWRYMRLESMQPDYLSATATSEKATDYRVEIRKALP